MADLNALEQQYNLPPGLLSAVQNQESGGNPNAVSPAGAQGAFQLMPATAKQYGVDPFDPDASAQAAAQMLGQLSSKYNGDIPSVLAGYNWGQGNVDRQGLQNAPPETQNYISKIMGKLGNEIVSPAYADTMPDLNSLPDDQLQKIANGTHPAYSPDSPLPVHSDYSPTAIQQAPLSAASVDLNNMSDEQLEKIANGNPDETKFSKAMGAVASSPLAALTSYGANAVSNIPGLKEAGSALAALSGYGQGDTFGQRYDNLEAAQKAMRQAGSQLQPGPTDAADISGSVAGLGLLGGLGSAVLPQSAATGLAAFSKANPYTASALGNGALGGIYGFSNGEDTADRLSGAATDAGLGALASVPLTAITEHVVAPLVGKLAQGAGTELANQASVKSADAAPLTKGQLQGVDVLKQALKTEGIDPLMVANSLEQGLQTGKPLTALDAATTENGGVITQGRNLVNLTKAAATFPGDAAALSGQVAARGAGAADRIAGDFDQTVSSNPFYGVLDSAAKQQQLAGPLYKQAFAANQSIGSPKIDRILNTPAGQSALQGAIEEMQNQMSLVGKPDPELTAMAKEAGIYSKGGVSNGLKLQTLDLVKQELDSQANAAYKAANSGNGSTMTANRIANLAKGLREELDNLDVTAKAGPNSLKPEGGAYAQARSNSAQGFQLTDAVDQGRNFTTQDPEEIKAFMSDPNTSQPQKAAYLAGVRRSIQDTADNKNMGANPIASLTKPAIQKRLAAAIGDPAKVADLTNRLNLENTMNRINQTHTGGSDTMIKNNFGDQIGQSSMIDPVKGIKAVLNPRQTAINLLDSSLQKKAAGISNEAASQIMKYMTSSDPALWRSLKIK